MSTIYKKELDSSTAPDQDDPFAVLPEKNMLAEEKAGNANKQLKAELARMYSENKQLQAAFVAVEKERNRLKQGESVDIDEIALLFAQVRHQTIRKLKQSASDCLALKMNLENMERERDQWKCKALRLELELNATKNQTEQLVRAHKAKEEEVMEFLNNTTEDFRNVISQKQSELLVDACDTTPKKGRDTVISALQSISNNEHHTRTGRSNKAYSAGIVHSFSNGLDGRKATTSKTKTKHEPIGRGHLRKHVFLASAPQTGSIAMQGARFDGRIGALPPTGKNVLLNKAVLRRIKNSERVTRGHAICEENIWTSSHVTVFGHGVKRPSRRASTA